MSAKATKIVTVPHASLRRIARPITALDTKIRELFLSLPQALLAARNPAGVGLAAPQIDSAWRVFALRLDPDSPTPPRLIINPEIIDQSDHRVTGTNPRQPDLEGCLSIPKLYGPVLRPEWVTLSFQSLEKNGELSALHTETFFDFPGRVVQHELDHLNGVLFTDHTLTQDQPLYQAQGDDLVRVNTEIVLSFGNPPV